MTYKVHVDFPGRILIVGFGSIGQGVLPLILRHIGIKPERITVVTAENAGAQVAQEFGVKFIREPLVREFDLELVTEQAFALEQDYQSL